MPCASSARKRALPVRTGGESSPGSVNSGHPMYEPLIPGSAIRRLWIGESELYRQHFLRLDAESRRNRFGGAVSDEFIGRYAQSSALSGAVIYGFFLDGVLRGAGGLRLVEEMGYGEAGLGDGGLGGRHGVGVVVYRCVLD